MFIGYCEDVEALIPKGATVVIPRGTLVRRPARSAIGPGVTEFAKRSFRVTVQRISNGFDRRHDAYSLRKGYSILENPTVVWSTSSGWASADLNSVILPGQSETAWQKEDRNAWFREVEFGSVRVLYDGGDVVAGIDEGCDRMWAATDEAAVRARILEFFGPGADLQTIPAYTPTGVRHWLHAAFMRPL